MIAGKVIDAGGTQSRFAFARNGPMMASDAFNDPLPGDLVQDSERVWFSGLGTLWLYAGGSLKYVRALAAADVVEVGGPCLT